MNVIEAIHRRRAVRQYLPDPVKNEDIQNRFDMALEKKVRWVK
jgi:nitroreductase